MKIQVKNSNSYDFNTLISAALINCWVTCLKDEFKDFTIYHSFNSDMYEDAESIYKYALKCIKYDFLKDSFKENVKLIN